LLGNRAFLVKMVRDPDTDTSEIQPIDYRDLAKAVTKSVSTCIAVYVTADIVRRVVVYAITAKI
jgi:hypothetical protein